MKIVFMGTPDFAVPTLQSLIDAGHEIQLVITQPDRKGNRNKIIPSPIKSLAERYSLNIAQPIRIKKDPDLIDKIKNLGPDFIVVAAFGQILPQEVLDIPKYGCINVHGSLLPAFRGAAPMQMSILCGLTESGVTIMKMEAGLDTGDMIAKTSCDISGKNITEVSELLSNAGAKLLVDTIESIANGTAKYEKQDDSQSSYAHMINKSDGLTDFNDAADILERKIRAYYEWPTLYSYLEGQQVKFFKAEAVMNEETNGEPGTIASIDKNSYSINCKKGILRILEQQLQGKKRMSAGDFMRGKKLTLGDKFEVN